MQVEKIEVSCKVGANGRWTATCSVCPTTFDCPSLLIGVNELAAHITVRHFDELPMDVNKIVGHS